MRRKTITSLAAAALIAAGMVLVGSAPAVAATVPGAPWIEMAPPAKAFPPLVPSVAKRPAILLETDNYVYGPGTGFTTPPELTITLNDRNYDDPVTLYLYWQNRVSGESRYYSLRTGGFGTVERDLFGAPGAPARVLTPDVEDFQLFGADGAFGALPGSVPTDTGHYQFVFEVRNANGQQVIARGNAMYNHVDGVRSHSGNVTASETWTSNFLHFLTAPVNFFDPAVLTIEAGSVIMGSKANEGTLVIRQGAKINAQGTADLPIIFTSEFPVGGRAPGDWGGLVINGFAPTNQENPTGEGDSGPYGGSNAADNSGTISFTRVEFAGIRFSETNELNGIALQGVGSGTTIDHVQVHHNKDDGIEFFGGTAQAKYVLITDAQDDSLDWTFGWAGKLQHFVAIQRTGTSDKLIEADNYDENPSALPRSAPMIANATFIGNRGTPDLVEPGEALRLRRGTAGNITHFIQMLAKEEGLRVTEDETLAILGTELQVRNGFFFDNDVLTDNTDVETYLLDPARNNSQENPRLPNPQSLIQPDIAPTNASPARNFGQLPVEFRNDPFFDSVNYAGGVHPNDPWIYEGWTTFSDN